MSDSTDVLVLGAGLAGLSTAVWLQRLGQNVTVLDRSEPGEGTSFGNAGIFANYATLPPVNRRTLAGLPRELLDRDSAVSVRPHYWPAMLRFGWPLWRETQQAAFARNRERLTALVRAADGAFGELVSFASADDLVVRQGCLAIYRDTAVWEAVRTQDMPMRQADGVECRPVNPAEIVDLEPALAGAEAVGGVFYPNTRHLLSPIALSRRLFDTFRRNGGHFEHSEARRITSGQSGSPLVHTDDEIIAAHHVVIALGPASRDLVAAMGLDVPLVSERGYHVTLEPEAVSLKRPVGWLEHYFYATPMRDGVRLAGTTEFARPDAPPDERRWSQLGNWAQTLFGPKAQVASRWHGSRATTPDSLPLIGSLPHNPNVFLASGHGHLGLTLSGITGKLIAEQITGEKPSYDPAAIAPGRFA